MQSPQTDPHITKPLHRQEAKPVYLRLLPWLVVVLVLCVGAVGLLFSLGAVGQGKPGTPASSTPANVVSSSAGGTTSTPANTLAPTATLPPPTQPPPPTATPTLTPFIGDPVAPIILKTAPGYGFNYFPETQHLAPTDLLAYYYAHDGAEMFGLPLTEEFAQKLPDGHVYMVQYFERARLELHPDLPPGQQVQLGALGSLVLAGRTFDTVPATESTDTSRYFAETGHTVSGGFLDYWTNHGGLSIFGLPLSEETDEDGITVQYFERARFEYYADLVGTGYGVQLSPIGYTALKAQGYNLPAGTLIRINPPTLAEGHSAVVQVAASPGVSVTAQYEGNALQFVYDAKKGVDWAVLGTVAFQDLGEHTITFTVQTATDTRTVIRGLNIVSYPFPEEDLQFDSATTELLGPQQQQENYYLATIFAGRTPHQYWDGAFRMPLNGSIDITSYFAARRCYGCDPGTPPTTYHVGMDMGTAVGTPVHAPAAGVIVFEGLLAERGNAIIIDHGMGVYSLFAHNSEFVAQVGDHVSQGDVISLSGNTGLSNGPHLHWELHVSGPPVEPREWVNRAMP